MTAWLRQNEWLPCQWCSSNECGGTCVSFTNQTLLGRPIVEADLGLGDVKDIVFVPPSIKAKARIMSQHDNGDGTVTIGVVFEEQPCPQHPSDTRPTASAAPAQQDGITHTPAPSEDTDAGGTERQRHG